jgi:hypothetical protein
MTDYLLLHTDQLKILRLKIHQVLLLPRLDFDLSDY